MPGYFVWSNLAGVMAWIQFFRGKYQPVWEPTRRPETHTSGAGQYPSPPPAPPNYHPPFRNNTTGTVFSMILMS